MLDRPTVDCVWSAGAVCPLSRVPTSKQARRWLVGAMVCSLLLACAPVRVVGGDARSVSVKAGTASAEEARLKAAEQCGFYGKRAEFDRTVLGSDGGEFFLFRCLE